MDKSFQAQARAMAATGRFPEPVYVTRPQLPPLDALMRTLEPAWRRRWITNEGCLHRELESALVRFLGVPHLSLFCNGAMALLTALKALDLAPGAVVTTAFTFPATVNALHWSNLRPVFCDIGLDSYNLDPHALEAHITPETRAILPVHVFGTPCDVEHIQDIANRHQLPVIYDAAHAFGVRYKGASILNHGRISMLSFHATKVFTTAEGGALATGDPELHQAIRLWKNFGIADEETVLLPGVNGKMNELQAALGLTQIDDIDAGVRHRQMLSEIYLEGLGREPGLVLPAVAPDVEHNYAYFPIRVQEELFGLDRDGLYTMLKEFNVFSRKYFYPLCSTYAWCRAEEGALPRAEQAAREVLCLPIYNTLPRPVAERICTIIRDLGALARG